MLSLTLNQYDCTVRVHALHTNFEATFIFWLLIFDRLCVSVEPIFFYKNVHSNKVLTGDIQFGKLNAILNVFQFKNQTETNLKNFK